MARDKFESQYILELADILTRNLNFKVDATMKEVVSVLGTLSRQEQNTYLREAALASRQPMNLGSLRHQFGNDTKQIVKVMYDREKQASKSLWVNNPALGLYISKGQLNQARDTFIKKLVTSLAQLPFFRTLSGALTNLNRNLAILGVSHVVAGVTSGNMGEFLLGSGELIVSAVASAIPIILSLWTQQLMTNTTQTLRLTGKILKGFGNIITTGVLKLFSSLAKGVQTLFTFIRYLYITSGIPQFFARLGSTIMQTVRFFGALFGLANAVGLLAGSLSILGGVLGALGIGKGAELWSSGKKGQGGAAIGTGIISVIAGIAGLILIPISGPLALIAGGVALIAGAISAIIAYWDEIIGTVKRILKPITDWFGGRQKAKEEKQAAQAQKENTQLSAAPTASKEVVESIAKNGPVAGTAKPTYSGGDVIFGRQGMSGKAVDKLGFNPGSMSRADIIKGISSKDPRFAKLESLQGFGTKGWSIDSGSFVNDVAAARAGTGAILTAVSQKMGGQNLVVTSALGSKTSPHSGKSSGKGHYEGQTLDFSAAGMTKAQAEDYAKRMYATGYFSHVTAERGKDGQYHLDARIADEAYKTFENATAESKKFEKDVDKAMKPSSTVVSPAPPGNNTLSYLKFGERSGEFGQRSLC